MRSTGRNMEFLQMKIPLLFVFVCLVGLGQGFRPVGKRAVGVPRLLRMTPNFGADSQPFSSPDEWEKYMADVASSKAIIPVGPEATTAALARSADVSLNKFVPSGAQNQNAKRYFDMVEKLTPNDMLQKFAKTAPRNVQEAAKSTVMSILGNLPNYALDAALVSEVLFHVVVHLTVLMFSIIVYDSASSSGVLLPAFDSSDVFYHCL